MKFQEKTAFVAQCTKTVSAVYDHLTFPEKRMHTKKKSKPYPGARRFCRTPGLFLQKSGFPSKKERFFFLCHGILKPISIRLQNS